MPTPVVIAHRGASGYLPEHTLEAKAAAHAMGADYIEQDIVATRDGVLLVLHDVYLEAVTDVEQKFADRNRSDGHYYVVDFDYEEIAQLNVHERTLPREREYAAQLYPDRFPTDTGTFRIATLTQELELINGLNRSTGRQAGIYSEIKDPAWHRENGIELSELILSTLGEYGYLEAPDAGQAPRAYLQCFDARELQRIRAEVNPDVPLVQLLTGRDDMSESGLDLIARYAQGIGPGFFSLVSGGADSLESNGVCSSAQARALAVHPYTFRRDQLPPFSNSFASLLEFFAVQVGVDGFFTDFPDIAVAVLGELNLD